MSDHPSTKATLKHYGLCLRATFGFAGAWLFWQIAVPGFELFAVFAIIFAIGGAICAGQALYHLFRLIMEGRSWAQYRARGETPKADKLASEDDLRARGYLK